MLYISTVNKILKTFRVQLSKTYILIQFGYLSKLHVLEAHAHKSVILWKQ